MNYYNFNLDILLLYSSFAGIGFFSITAYFKRRVEILLFAAPFAGLLFSLI